MKNLKRIISMVLVVAMLASFAGMTGYVPSIVAEAASRVTHTFEGGYSVTVADTWYKTTYNLSGVHPIYLGSTNMPDDYYGIPNALEGNDLNITFNVPENAKWSFYQFLTDRRTDGTPDLSGAGNIWGAGGTGGSAVFNGLTETTRGEVIFERDELGSLFDNQLNNEGAMGFRDIDTIYLVLEYWLDNDSDGVRETQKFGYIDVAVEFAPSEPANKTGSVVPKDTKAGLDAAKITVDMPATFYTVNGVITNTAGLDTIFNYTLPSGAKNATLKAVTAASDSSVKRTWNLTAGAASTVDFNEITASTITDGSYIYFRLDYTVAVANTPYNTKTGSVLDTDYSEQGDVSKSAYSAGYEPHPDVDLPDTVDVTYTQYLAAYVKELPEYKLANLGRIRNNYNVINGEKMLGTFYQRIDMSPFLQPGFSIVMGNTGDQASDGESGYYSGKSQSFTNYSHATGSLPDGTTGYDTYTYMSVYAPSGYNHGGWGEDYKYWVMGNNEPIKSDGSNGSSASVGTTIYFDSQGSAPSKDSVSLSVYSLFDGTTESANSHPGFRPTAGYYYFGKMTKGSTYTHKIADSASQITAGTDYSDMQLGANQHAASDWTSGMDTSSRTYAGTTMKFLKAAYDETATYMFFVRPEWSGKRTVCLTLAYYFEFIKVERGDEHTVIDAAKTKNYVEAEMDSTWWAEYRTEVLKAYCGLGDLTNAGGYETDFNSKIANGKATDTPIYKYANPDGLRAALHRTPAYDRGSTITDANQVGTSALAVGSKFASVVGADYVTALDPSDRSYTDTNYCGNGVNNLDNASLYRYSGAYFYTDASWKDYATERFYAYNIVEFQNDVYPHITFDYGSSGMGQSHEGGSKKYLATYLQSIYNDTTDRLNEAYNNLELRTLAEFKMRDDKKPTKDYDGDGVADNVTTGGGAWVYDNGNQIIGYDAIMAYLESLIPTDTYTYYTTVSDANGDGKIDASDKNGDGYIDDLNPVTAQVYDTTQLEALLSQMKTKFHADDTVVDMGLEFEDYIENFLALVEITKKNPVDANNDAWTQIFTYLNGTSVAGDLRPSAGLKAVNFVDEVAKIYTLTTEERNNFQSLIDTYNTAAAPDPTTYITTRNALSQGNINSEIGNFFTALMNAFPSIQVAQAGENANNIAKDQTAVFEIYAPSQSSNFTESIYTSTSIGELETKVAEAMGLNKYTFAWTTWQSLVDRKNEIESWATVYDEKTNPAGLLKNNFVNITELEKALDYAKNFRDTDNTISVSSPDGSKTVTQNKYSEQSVAELNVVISEAQSVYDTNKANPAIYTNQLAIDKLTFALYEESDDAKLNLIKGNPGSAYRTWTYDAATGTATYEENWDDDWFSSRLYGVRDNDGSEEGLKLNTAYYGFLEAELSTPYTSDGLRVDNYEIWGEDGKLKYNPATGEPVAQSIFEGTKWGEYTSAYKAAKTLAEAATKLDVNSQSAIDDAAKALYNARNALQFNYFPSNTKDFQTALDYYKTLDAFFETTPITRYEIVTAGDGTVTVQNSTVDNVPIYSFPTLSEAVQTPVYEKVTNAEGTTVLDQQGNPIYNPVNDAEGNLTYTQQTDTRVILEAYVTMYRAKYASSASTEDYDSLDAAIDLYAYINGGKDSNDNDVVGLVKTFGITLKSANDESFQVGFDDLKEKFIAGTYENGTYDSALIAKTYDAASGTFGEFGEQGKEMERLLDAIAGEFTDAPATAQLGEKIKLVTDKLFTYTTTTHAYDLQFATYMRDSELYPFLDLEITSAVDFYYENGTHTYKVFNEEVVSEIKKGVDELFGEESKDNWPLIYEVNGIVWNSKGDAAVVEGYTDTAKDHVYNGKLAYINKVLGQVGSFAMNYLTAATNINNYNSTPYFWLINNAFDNDGDTELVLGDVTAVRTDGTAPFNYDMSIDNGSWYTEGYGVGGGKYYNYTEWFSNNVDKYLEAGVIEDEIGIDYVEDPTKIKIGAYFAEENEAEYSEILSKEGWSKGSFADFVEYAEDDQACLDDMINKFYTALQGLQLKPATDAYREVFNEYAHAIYAKEIVNWPSATAYSVNNDDLLNKDTGKLLDDYKIYNFSEAFLGKLGGNYELYPDETNPEYGLVKNTNDLYNQYKQDNQAWTDVQNFIKAMIAENGKVTIDKADDIRLVKDDGKESYKEKLISLLAKLELKDLNFELLDTLIDAFFTGKLQTLVGNELFEEKGHEIKSSIEGSNGQFYDISWYTDESLLGIAKILVDNKVVKDDVIAGYQFTTDGSVFDWSADFKFGNSYEDEHKGSFYGTVTDQELIDGSEGSMVATLVEALNNDLVLKLVDLTQLKQAIEQGDAVVAAKFDQTDPSWGTYQTELEKAKELVKKAADENYDIRKQEKINTQTNALLTAISDLVELADAQPPVMTIGVTAADVKEFYKNYGNSIDDNDTNPTAATFVMADNGYSLMVYTNQLNPRIIINLEDVNKELTQDGSVVQAPVKKEYMSITAVKTATATANVIVGELGANGEISDTVRKEAATSTNAVTLENSNTTYGSSVFAVLAPTFTSGTASQAALYTIEARDGSARTSGGTSIMGNAVNEIDFGIEDKDAVKLPEGEITVYVYYHNSMAADGTDEGITANEETGKPATNGAPTVLLEDEPTYDGNWRAGLVLKRLFSSVVRNWEFVSTIVDNNVSGHVVPVYNDPNFETMNTGSFYYVLDKNVALDAEVIEKYNEGKSENLNGKIDYDRATEAKKVMLDGMTADVLAAMRESKRFYDYGADIQWSQWLNDKVENGDLVFVHVVDRWGNVVNRIIEVTQLDKIKPVISSEAAGAVKIVEDGGSGVANINIWNGMNFEGEFASGYEYENSQTQITAEDKRVGGKLTVSCSGNVLTVSKLRAGGTYYLDIYDKAGSIAQKTVMANADGELVFTIVDNANGIGNTGSNNGVSDGEEGVATQSATFTLNGTDTIILNAGQASSVIDASLEGNVFANEYIEHEIITTDEVTKLKEVNSVEGTVVEWTEKNAYVTDNGDGTLTWLIDRVLTEGEHNYKIYAMVNGEYETFYAPSTITATTKSVVVTYTVVGIGRTYLKYSGSSAIKNSTYDSRVVPYGAKVTITAQPSRSDCDFYYWMNNNTDRIISTADIVEFKAVTNTDYIAQFTNSSTYYNGKKLVVYVNNAKNVINTFELADGESYTVPTGPVLPDYTFLGWSMTKEEVIASELDTIIVEPIYKLSAENTVTVTEGNYTTTGAGTYTAQDNERAVATVSASETDNDGKEFLYWFDAETEEIVSYYRTYSFFVVKDTVLTPVYGDASTLVVKPIVRISEVRYNALSGKVSFFAERSVPEEFTLLQTGIIVTKTESIGTNDEAFVVGGASTATGTSTSTAGNGYYSAATAITTGQTVWARAYAIYETADGEILEAYGPVASYTVD